MNTPIGGREHRGRQGGSSCAWATPAFVRAGLGAVWAFMVTDPSVHPGPIPVFMPDRSQCSRWTETRSAQHYDVFEIAASDLEDREAMARHFYRLARAIMGQDRAREIRDRPIWFGG